MRRAGVLAKSSASSTSAWRDWPPIPASIPASRRANPSTYAESLNRSRRNASPVSAVVLFSALISHPPARAPGDHVAVVAQKDLLERRRGAGQRLHVELDEALEDRVQLPGVDREARTRPLDSHVVHPAQPAQRDDRFGGLHDDRRAGQVTEVGKRSRLGSSAGPDDRDAIAERLHLGEDVAGQEDRSTRVAQLANELLEDDLHQGVEA